MPPGSPGGDADTATTHHTQQASVPGRSAQPASTAPFAYDNAADNAALTTAGSRSSTSLANAKPLSASEEKQAAFRQSGRASWYGGQFHGRRTANGERFDMNALTAAHRTLPLGSFVRVTVPATQRSVVVRINDRGPYVRGRVLDLSYAAAKVLGLRRLGTAKVTIEGLTPEEAKAERNETLADSGNSQ